MEPGGEVLRASTPIGALMRKAPIGIALVDSAGLIIDANDEARRLLADAHADVEGMSISEVARRALDECDDGRFTVERTSASGDTQILSVVRTLIDGGPVAAMFVIQDITTEAIAERELRASRAQLQFQAGLLAAQSEAAVEGILVVGPEGQILSYNSRFVEMWNIPDEVVRTRSDDAAIASVLDLLQDPDAFRERIRYLYAHPRETSRDELRLRDGRVFHRYSAPIIGDAERTHGRVWFFHDVTEQRRNEDALRFAAEAADILAETLDPHITLARIARLAVPRLCDWCVIYRQKPDRSIHRVAIEYADPRDAIFAREIERYTVDPDAPEGVSAVIRDGVALLRPMVTPEELSHDVQGGEAFVSLVREIGVTSWMSVPLEARGRVIGAISFVASRSGREYTEHDLALAEDLGHRAGLAMDNAALFDQQRHIARTLQESLLPDELPIIPGLDVAVRYIAAGEGHEVGGDFYDMFATDDGGCGLVVGDVVGKGPEAATLTALARYTVRAAALDSTDPGVILGLLNQAIHRQHAGRKFCTAVYASIHLDGDGAGIGYARGGHPPPLIVRADGSVEEAWSPGWLLGAFPEAHLTAGFVRLGAGDSLVVYTDGVIEARSESGAFGEHGLRRLLTRLVGISAEDCADEITHAVLDLQGGRPRDDIALVVLRVLPHGERLGNGASHRTVDSPWLPPRADGAVAVRRFVRGALGGSLSEEAIETVALVADELAINAIRHAATEYRVRVKSRGSRVRIEVRDLSRAEPRMMDVSPDALGGRGLQIVNGLSLRWGVARREDGKVVWAELDLGEVRGA